jgi:hypothetical protein
MVSTLTLHSLPHEPPSVEKAWADILEGEEEVLLGVSASRIEPHFLL